ncbi:MAG: DUF664 domain-containing protein [Nakamurella sp.]
MTNDIAVDTTIAEPAPTAGELEMLTFALNRSRAQFAWKVGGLDATALHQPQPPSAMTIGSIIKHLAWVQDWTAVRLTGRVQEMVAPWRSVDWDADPEYPWRTAVEDSPGELYGLWTASGERLKAAIDEVIADGGLDRPVQFTFDPTWTPNARRVLVDLHDEYARHVGHVDLFREAIDGLVGEDPPQH